MYSTGEFYCGVVAVPTTFTYGGGPHMDTGAHTLTYGGGPHMDTPVGPTPHVNTTQEFPYYIN